MHVFGSLVLLDALVRPKLGQLYGRVEESNKERNYLCKTSVHIVERSGCQKEETARMGGLPLRAINHGSATVCSTNSLRLFMSRELVRRSFAQVAFCPRELTSGFPILEPQWQTVLKVPHAHTCLFV